MNVQSNLGVLLLNTLENYVITKDKPKENPEWACKLFSLITVAYGANVIDIGDAAKFKKCEEENQRLREVQIELEAKILKLKEDNEDLHKILDTFSEKSSVTENAEK